MVDFQGGADGLQIEEERVRDVEDQDGTDEDKGEYPWGRGNGEAVPSDLQHGEHHDAEEEAEDADEGREERLVEAVAGLKAGARDDDSRHAGEDRRGEAEEEARVTKRGHAVINRWQRGEALWRVVELREVRA